MAPSLRPGGAAVGKPGASTTIISLIKGAPLRSSLVRVHFKGSLLLEHTELPPGPRKAEAIRGSLECLNTCIDRYFRELGETPSITPESAYSQERNVENAAGVPAFSSRPGGGTRNSWASVAKNGADPSLPEGEAGLSSGLRPRRGPRLAEERGAGARGGRV